ncbi:MAG: SPOR domain-containing protein [Planctomycetes bacterium]|nr:SPOR domain-containing protein [Planctomycetota bacterium]
MKTDGLKPWVEPKSRSGEVLYTVYAGSFTTYAQARDALPRVQRSAPGAHIVP